MRFFDGQDRRPVAVLVTSDGRRVTVPLDELEAETVKWCKEMLQLSPFSLRLMKASFNADEDGLAGIQQLAHDANLLFYMSEEAAEGRQAYLEKRPPDFSKFPHRA